jgi:hypothetical protein
MNISGSRQKSDKIMKIGMFAENVKGSYLRGCQAYDHSIVQAVVVSIDIV